MNAAVLWSMKAAVSKVPRSKPSSRQKRGARNGQSTWLDWQNSTAVSPGIQFLKQSSKLLARAFSQIVSNLLVEHSLSCQWKERLCKQQASGLTAITCIRTPQQSAE